METSATSGLRNDDRFDELAEKFAARCRRGERPNVEEYVERLPGMGRRLAMVGTGEDVELWDLAALNAGLTDLSLAWDGPAPAANGPPPGHPPRSYR